MRPMTMTPSAPMMGPGSMGMGSSRGFSGGMRR
jgi:hypothetical protein